MEDEKNKDEEEVITLKDILNLKEIENKIFLKRQLKIIQQQKIERLIEELEFLTKKSFKSY